MTKFSTTGISFIEFKKYSCKYKVCMHNNEKEDECAIKRAVRDGEILLSRYENYIKFLSRKNE